MGCDEEGSTVGFYQAPNETARPASNFQGGGATAGAPAAAQQPGRLRWTVPAGWKEMPAQQMRVATFLVNEGQQPPVELTVIPLGQEAGDVLANVNRWEEQLGLAKSSKENLGKVTQHRDVNGLHIDVVDLTGPETQNPRQRMLAAMVPFGSQVWFFKMTGPVETVSAQKEKFDAFVGSLAPEGGAPAGQQQQQQTAQAGPAAPAKSANIIGHATPAGWRVVPAGEPPRMLTLEVGPEGDAKAKAEMAVTRFASNNVGSFLDNINRWRGQIGLPPVQDAHSLPMKDTVVADHVPGVSLEFESPASNDHPARRMIVVITSTGADLWFFKFTGPDQLVADQRANFEAFLKSVQFDDDGHGHGPHDGHDHGAHDGHDHANEQQQGNAGATTQSHSP